MKFSVKLAGILSSATLFTTGAIFLFKSMSLDLSTVLHACKLSISAAIVVGFLGYLIGKIFEKGGNHKVSSSTNSGNSSLLIDDLLIDDIDRSSEIKE